MSLSACPLAQPGEYAAVARTCMPSSDAFRINASHPLDERFAVTAEVSGVAQRGTAAQAQGLLALSYNVSRALVLDVAVAAGLSRSAADLQVMTGFTVQLGHWF